MNNANNKLNDFFDFNIIVCNLNKKSFIFIHFLNHIMGKRNGAASEGTFTLFLL